ENGRGDGWSDGDGRLRRRPQRTQEQAGSSKEKETGGRIRTRSGDADQEHRFRNSVRLEGDAAERAQGRRSDGGGQRRDRQFGASRSPGRPQYAAAPSRRHSDSGSGEPGHSEPGAPLGARTGESAEAE